MKGTNCLLTSYRYCQRITQFLIMEQFLVIINYASLTVFRFEPLIVHERRSSVLLKF